ncbi:hypothetical protein [Acidisarcina polymorpha]|nr:hypothetical protein [Acidisarcina polymorpha]
MTDFETTVLNDLSLVKSEMAVLKNQMASLVGAGQPGRLYALEHRLDQHERGIQHAKGAIAAFGVIFTLIEVAVRYLHER